jgi:hypothetical protein
VLSSEVFVVGSKDQFGEPGSEVRHRGLYSLRGFPTSESEYRTSPEGIVSYFFNNLPSENLLHHNCFG